MTGKKLCGLKIGHKILVKEQQKMKKDLSYLTDHYDSKIEKVKK